MKRTDVYKKSYMYICNWTIDFARSHKKEIVDHIKDITEWYEYEDIDVSVIVT